MEIMLSHLGVGMAYSAANSSSALHGEAFLYAENHSLGEWFQKDFIGE